MQNKNQIILIAEAGVNHNGSLQKAYKLIDIASYCGANYIKFQITDASVISTFAKKAKYQIDKKNTRESQYLMIKRLEMEWSKIHPLLIKRCKKKNIKFLTSIFDSSWIDEIKKLNLDYIKIPSGEINNFPLLKSVTKLKKKILLSTGASNILEIECAVNFLLKNGIKKKNLTIMHCNSAYPTPINDVNLLAINYLKKKFKLSVGFSDHSLGSEAGIASVALGVKVIEKHFTISNFMRGPDHKISLNPKQLKNFVTSIRKTEKALGKNKKFVTNSEKVNRNLIRKSIYANTDIKKNEFFTNQNIKLKRPGTGLKPIQFEKMIGKKSKKNFKFDQLIHN
jgi:N,N'-diacetyllegionaminate synthase